MPTNTYRMAALGDSISRGQGLREEEEAYSVVARLIEAAKGNTEVVLTIGAHSGAKSGYDKNGNVSNSPSNDWDGRISGYQELPAGYPTLREQCEKLTDEMSDDDRAEVDLVLLDFGINDIGVETILNPTTSAQDLRSAAQQHCYSNATLILTKTSEAFPEADIIVTGYYPIVSQESDFGFLIPFLMSVGVLGIAVGPLVSLLSGLVGVSLGGSALVVLHWVLDVLLPLMATPPAMGAALKDLKNAMAENSRVFSDQSTAALRNGVDKWSATSGSHSTRLAIPLFQAKNSIFASRPLLFRFGTGRPEDFSDPTGCLSPQDPMAPARLAACKAVPWQGGDMLLGRLASVGHPNSMGARNYAFAILCAWEGKGLWGGIVGNGRTLEFHAWDCRYVGRMKDKNIVVFPSVDSALDEGYNGCHYCQEAYDQR